MKKSGSLKFRVGVGTFLGLTAGCLSALKAMQTSVMSDINKDNTVKSIMKEVDKEQDKVKRDELLKNAKIAAFVLDRYNTEFMKNKGREDKIIMNIAKAMTATFDYNLNARDDKKSKTESKKTAYKNAINENGELDFFNL